MTHSLLLRQAVVAVLALAAVPAVAQEPDEPGRALETIVVTAQKREQSLQDVPIVVTAVSAQLLKDSGVKDIKDLTLLTPGLLVTSTSNESVTTARIRGIGTVGDNPGLESSVGVVIDGVYRPRNGVSFGDLGELERIEVLKGPQGTLFGKNTSAGVINVVSKKPSFDFGSDVELSAGNYGAIEAAASLTGPLSDQVAGRLYLASRERDGFLDIDRGPGPREQDEDNNRKFYTARGQLLFQPSDTLDIRMVADYSERDEDCCVGVQAVLSPSAAVLGVLNALQPGSISNPADPFERLGHANRSSEQSVTDQGVSLEVNWDLQAFGGARLTSVTAWRDWETVNAQDTDFTTVDILYREGDGSYSNQFEQLSEELRLSGESGRLNWLFGAFYAGEDLDAANSTLMGTQLRAYLSNLLGNPTFITDLPADAFPAGLGSQDTYKQESTSWALFTNNSLRLSDSLELTMGLRYTDESKDLDSQYRNTHGAAGCGALRYNVLNIQAAIAALPPALQQQILATTYGIGCAAQYADPIFGNLSTTQSAEESEWSGTAKLAWRLSEDVLTYASFARGYKAGGFNLDRERTGNIALHPGLPGGVQVDTDTSFDRELVDSYELGLKTQWLGNSLLLNGALFYQDYEHFQLNTFTGTEFVVTSIPRVVSQGMDADLIWRTPLEQLSLQGGVTYAETEIREFGAAAAFFRPERENDRLSFAPKWSASMSLTFEQPIGPSLQLRSNLGAKYTSEYNTGSNLDPRKLQSDVMLVNARLGIGALDEHWTVELWAQNLTDEDYYQVAFDATLQGSSAGAVPSSTINAFLGAPRTYGLTTRFKF